MRIIESVRKADDFGIHLYITGKDRRGVTNKIGGSIKEDKYQN